MGVEPDPIRPLERTTDADGRICIELDVGGPWMLTALHMTRITDCAGIDWKSYWASTTFELPSIGGKPAARRR